jgi:hypothetical protein
MPRLYRPTVPIEIKCRVALRHLGELDVDNVIEAWRPSRGGTSIAGTGRVGMSHGRLFEYLLPRVAELFDCKVEDLRLDHDPPLAARVRVGFGKNTYYVPDANDPDHLFYRPHGPEFAGSHLIKTNCRGDHGQHPDRVLIKKMRRIERGPRPKRHHGLKKNPKAPKRAWPSRPFPSSKGRK